MRPFTLVRQSLAYYRGTNLPVIAAVAVAVAVIAGAMLVGESVQASLRRLALERLGKTQHVLSTALFFSEETAQAMGGVPMIVLTGTVTRPEGGARAGDVAVYGIDERFWQFHGVSAPESSYGTAWVSPAIAAELGVKEQETLLVRVERPSAIPKESLHGAKDDTGKTFSVQASGALSRAQLGEFALKPKQSATRAVFVNLKMLQRQLTSPAAVNTALFGEGAAPDLSKLSLADLGVRVQAVEGGASVESASAIVNDTLAAQAVELGGGPGKADRIFTYMVNEIRFRDRVIPYSVVSAVDPSFVAVAPGEIVMTDWAARDLGAKAGDSIAFEYYYWLESGALETRKADFRVARVVPLKEDRKLAPEYPGISDSLTLSEWNPPFPVDLKKVRPIDEDYWKKYNTTPKAFFSLADGQRMWGSRFGHTTSVRVRGVEAAPFGTALRAKLTPAQMGAALVDLRASALESSRGSTDFGEYFSYFSFFLVISALLLLVVFFQLNVDQRLRQLGVMRAVGLDRMAVVRSQLGEGVLLALIGSAIGALLAVAYAAFIVYGLKTWWRDAVGTSDLVLTFRPINLLAGFRAGFITAAITMFASLMPLRRVSPVSLLAGTRGPRALMRPKRAIQALAIVLAGGAIALVAAGATKSIAAAGGFFGGGFLLLIAAILFLWNRWRGLAGSVDTLNALGFRNAAWKPGRSALCVALIASAVFLLVSLEVFRQGESSEGTGGFGWIAESQLPVVYDLNTAAGREALGLAAKPEIRDAKVFSFRVRPGDDASCLNLYEPRNPRVVGAPKSLVDSKRLAGPWDLLGQAQPDGSIAAIADANSIQYVLHKKVGDTIALSDGVKLKLVGALAGSMLQSELIIAEQDFVRAFPREQGFRFFLIDGSEAAGAAFEDALADFGFDATPARERLAAYHRVENTYLSTFQALGALGLLLGVVGMAAVLLRNVLERRQQLGLLRAVGFGMPDLTRMVLAENVYLVGCGLAIGIVCAAVAVAPAWLERGARLPGLAMLVLLIAVPAIALAASLAAVRYLNRLNLLASLKEDAF